MIFYNQQVKDKRIIQAFDDSDVFALAINEDGSLISVADNSGYLIKVFTTENSELIHSFY